MGSAGAPVWTGLKGFQGLDGQWKGSSFAGEPACLEPVVSSSEDSSLAEGLGGNSTGGDEGEGTVSKRKFLSGDQPGGRRLVST